MWGQRFLAAWVCGILVCGAVSFHTQAPLVASRCPVGNQQGNGETAPENCASFDLLFSRSISDWWAGTTDFIDRYHEHIAAFATVVIAIYTIILGKATLGLRDATKSTVESLEQTAERQLRAYVAISAESVQNFDTTQPVRVQVALRNAGQTPAYELEFSGSVVVMTFPYVPGVTISYAFPDNISKTVLHPGHIFYATARTKDIPTQKSIDDTRIGTDYRVYAGGVARYKDAFGKQRETRFLASAGGKDFADALDAAGADMSKAPINWGHTSEHNEAT